MKVRVDSPLRAGRYFIGVALTRSAPHDDLLFEQPHAGDFLVTGDVNHGLVSIAHELELEHGRERATP